MQTPQYTAGDVLSLIQSQAFLNWYDEEFDRYIRGENNSKSRDAILADIKKMLN